MNQELLALLGLIVLAIAGVVLTIGLVTWARVFSCIKDGRPILPHEPRRLAVWGLFDLLAFVAIFITLDVAAINIATSQGMNLTEEPISPQNSMFVMLMESSALMATSGLSVALIKFRSNYSWSELGLSPKQLTYDIRIGAIAFCALAIPTYLIQSLLVQFWPSEHPLIEALKENPTLTSLSIAIFSAVVAAPLVEEFLFRGLFQGWLEKLFDQHLGTRPLPIQNLLFGASRWRENATAPVIGTLVHGDTEKTSQNVSNALDTRVIEDPAFTYKPSSNPYVSPAAASESPIVAEAGPMPLPEDWYDDSAPSLRTDIVAIGASSAVFAFMHNWPDCIPLIVLAMGLGYLYRRTHRLAPCITVHLMLNALSMLGLIITILQK